ncbi:reverse transcriptase domain-containing protein [Tanacetum coccineum]|uniref:Reverse transcriptase domain-containing protein n=1 Tax=Tanacetum coccineum TaxID=301880 RepID=A0ABQ5CRN3_9ASTR
MCRAGIELDWDLPFERHVDDASDLAIGAGFRTTKDNQLSAIHYARKTLTKLKYITLPRKENAWPLVVSFGKVSEYLVLTKEHRANGHLAYKVPNEQQYSKPRQGKISQRDEMPQNAIQVCEIFDVEAKALPTNDARVVVKFLKSLFARFGTPRAIINDRGTYFYNDQFTKVMFKYGVTHRLATAYHPQTNGQVEVSNRGLKRILERTVGENRASWSDKLDDALWAFQHKAYWALKHANFDLKTAGDHRKLQLNELNELRDQAYENSLIYKERTKKLHDSKIKNRIFNVGDRVLLFNSRLKILSGKLKTSWSGPFTISKVFPYGTIELSQPDGPNLR